MKNRECWRELRNDYGFDKKTACRIRDEIASYFRTNRYEDANVKRQKASNAKAYISGILLENGKGHESEEKIRKTTNDFIYNSKRLALQESLMGALVYIISFMEMLKTLAENIFSVQTDNVFVCFAEILFGSEQALEEIGMISSALMYFLVLCIWVFLEQKILGSKYEKAVHYYNRDAAQMTVLFMILFYISGYIVQLFRIFIFGMDAYIELFTVITFVVRVMIVMMMAAEPVYLIHYWSKIDDKVDCDLKKFRSSKRRNAKIVIRLKIEDGNNE